MAKSTEELHRWIATLDNAELLGLVAFIDGLTLGRDTALASAANANEKKPRKPSHCKLCGLTGHRAPNCQKYKQIKELLAEKKDLEAQAKQLEAQA